MSSIDSTCLKHINQMVHGNLIRKLFFSDEELKNYDNVGKLDKNLVVMKIKKFIQNGQSKRTILVKSDKLSESIQKNSNLLSIEDELPLANKNIVVASDTSSAPSTSTKPVEKCKLLIERVYSLSMPLDIDDKK